jgi:transposase InsO family protein
VFEQRKLFIQDYLSQIFSISDLCRIYEICRPTAYLWIQRFKEEGEDGLRDRKSTPQNQPLATPSHVIDEILAVKFKFMKWGPKKIVAHLNHHKPQLILPSTTTVGNILDRNGLVMQRALRKRFTERTQPLAHAKEINDVWSADFKGGSVTNDKQKCEPFTLTDNASRYLLKCLTLDANNTDHVWAVLDSAFREYGLPLYLRSDNGPPFASQGLGRLSSLTVKLIRAGVVPDFIDPGKPEQNGRHERMHGTLKSEAIFPEVSLEEQKIKLKDFQYYYNFVRPHEGINQATPGSVYATSNRVWTGKLKSPEYPDDYRKVRVRISGQILINDKDIYIGKTLKDEYVGLKETETGFKMYYGPVYLAEITEDGAMVVSRRKGRDRSKKFKSDFY